MAYSDFTLESLQHKFGLNITFTNDAFADIAPVTAPADIVASITKFRPLAVGAGTEKARSEFLIAPLLGQIYYETNQQSVVLSGVEFNVDRKQGLHGFCDFLISRSPGFIMVNAPVVAVVEAKKEDLNPGVAQCIASMVAVRLFNENKKKPIDTIYGSVTSGTLWRFLRLRGNEVTADLSEYGLAEIDKIFGILLYMTRGDENKTAA